MEKNKLKPVALKALLAVSFLAIFLGGEFLFSPSANAVIASPARLEIEADPGEKVSSQLTLINNEETAKTFYSSAENFEAQGETGNPQFVSSDEDLATWIELPSQITLEPKEKRKISFSVDVPTDAGVGGHFAAIFWGINPPAVEGGQVAIGAKVGVLVFLKVRGGIIEKGEVIEFGSLAEKKIYDSLPVDFSYRFENSGNDRTKPIGELIVKNIFNKELEKIPANEKQGSVLPESVRKFFISWGRDDAEDVERMYKEKTLYPPESFLAKAKRQMSPFAMGRYSADLNLDYGLQGNKANAQFVFWIIPWQLITIILLILLVVLFGGKLLLKKYNKSVIAKAQKAQRQEAQKKVQD